MKLATAKQMKELDRRAIHDRQIPSLDLMEHAAAGLCSDALELLTNRPNRCRASVFCGSGNNGGDGIAAARLMFLAGVKVRVFLVGSYEKLTPDSLEMTGRLSECGLELEPFHPDDENQRVWILTSDLLMDALFGVGLSREILPDSPYSVAIERINAANGKVIAADIASGVAADTGNVLGCGVKADWTTTFTLPKVGQFVGDGSVLSGTVRVWEIGVPKDLVEQVVCPVQTVEEEFVRAFLPPRRTDGHKGDFGKLLVIGGCVGFTGAPYLVASAGAHSGCGLIFLGVPESIWPIEAAKCISAMPFPLSSRNGMISGRAASEIRKKLDQCDVLALGPGLGRSEDITRTVCSLLQETEKPVVLDADGINAISGHMDILDARRGRITILTPHDGEFARLGGDLSTGDRAGAASAFATAHGCTLVLKGHHTITATPEGNILVNTTGNSGLAKGGSGDVLTGIIASLLCQGAGAAQAAACGVWLHGRAGDLAALCRTEYGMTPSDVVEMLPQTFGNLLNQNKN